MWRPDYVTLEEQKRYMKIPDSDDDAEIQTAITAASRAVDAHCRRQFGQVEAPEQRAYTAWFSYRHGRWVVPIDDLTDVTDLTVNVDGKTGEVTFDLFPSNAMAEGKAYTALLIRKDSPVKPSFGYERVLSTGIWGWSAFPGQVVYATKLQASRFYVRRESPYGIAGSPDQGNELRLLSRVDPDVAVSLRGLRRPRRVG